MTSRTWEMAQQLNTYCSCKGLELDAWFLFVCVSALFCLETNICTRVPELLHKNNRLDLHRHLIQSWSCFTYSSTHVGIPCCSLLLCHSYWQHWPFFPWISIDISFFIKYLFSILPIFYVDDLFDIVLRCRYWSLMLFVELFSLPIICIFIHLVKVDS